MPVLLERFSNDCRKTKTKAIITPTNHNRSRQRDEPITIIFLAILCNLLQAQEKSRLHGAIDFGFASHWLKDWHKSFKPITKRSNRDHVSTFDSHLKTALMITKTSQLVHEKSPSCRKIKYVHSNHVLMS